MYQPTIDNDELVNIRNTRDGFVFELPEDSAIEKVIEHIHEVVQECREYLRNAQVIVDFCDRPPDGLEARQIEQALLSTGVGVRRVTASRPGLRPDSGSNTAKNKFTSSGSARLAALEVSQNRTARYVRKNIRAGETIRTESDLVLLGDVKPGATVFAGGDVIVWGSLCGTVRAGANPAANDATICALHFQPAQIQIGRLVATPSNIELFDTSTPLRAYRDGGSIIVKPWQLSDEWS